jgi:LysM repeat protein
VRSLVRRLSAVRAPRTAWWALAAVAAVIGGAACSGGDDGGGAVTLPPIATTSTIAPSTTVNLLDQDRFVVIEQGDNLSSIAQRYQVSQDDLMALNGITDPNAVFLGQVLELPAGAVLPVDPSATSLVAPTAAP